MGIMFLVFMPVPYVEASAAAAFGSKWQRAFVAGAGIMVEVTLAAIALAVWLNVEPGLVRTIAFNTMLIAGVSTVLFNGNPLLRFDGYYVLADLLEVPNLGNRSNKHLLHLIQRYGFGLRASRSPATARGERFWFVLYGLAALAYRLFIMTVIVVFVATHFFVVGVLLAIWSATLMLVWPVLKGAWFVLTSPRLDRVRGRAMGVTLGTLGAGLALIPLPHATLAQGVQWIPDHAVVHAQGTGTVFEVIAPPGSRVAPGDPPLRLEDPLIQAEIDVVDARIAELRLTLAAVEIADRVEAARVHERLGQAERQQGLELRRTAEGVFVLPDADDLPGRFICQGQPLGYVGEGGTPVIRTLGSDRDIDLVRHRTRDVQVRFSDRLDDILPARLRAQTPGLTARCLLSERAVTVPHWTEKLVDACVAPVIARTEGLRARRLSRDKGPVGQLLPRGLHFAIVDEAEHLHRRGPHAADHLGRGGGTVAPPAYAPAVPFEAGYRRSHVKTGSGRQVSRLSASTLSRRPDARPSCAPCAGCG